MHEVVRQLVCFIEVDLCSKQLAGELLEVALTSRKENSSLHVLKVLAISSVENLSVDHVVEVSCVLFAVVTRTHRVAPLLPKDVT